MEDDLTSERTKLLSSEAYAAHRKFRDTFSWYSQRTGGDILIDSTSKQNAVVAVVGCVPESRLDCDARGGFRKRNFEMLAKAKYQLLIQKPTDCEFADDFDVALQNLTHIQSLVESPSHRSENFIIQEHREKKLRFTREVFEERHPAVKGTL